MAGRKFSFECPGRVSLNNANPCSEANAAHCSVHGGATPRSRAQLLWPMTLARSLKKQARRQRLRPAQSIDDAGDSDVKAACADSECIGAH